MAARSTSCIDPDSTDPMRLPCGRCRQTHARCAAHRRDGQPCGRWPRTGATVCRQHGGDAPQVRAAAARRTAVAEITTAYDGPGDAESIVTAELHRGAALIAWLEQVLDLDADDPETLAETLRVLRRERAHLNVAADRAMRAGLAERQIRATEKLGEMFGQLVRGLIDDLGLQGEQRDLALSSAKRRFLVLAGGQATG